MDLTTITSRRHETVGRFRDAIRHPGSDLMLDGPHLVAAALDADLHLTLVAVSTSALDGDGPTHVLLGRLAARGVPLVTTTTAVMDAISPVRAPTGIVALAERPPTGSEALLHPPPPLILVAVDVQDPGNVGALIRAADAAGATGVITTEACADPFGWKALRGAMGSSLRLPLWPQAPGPQVLGFLRERRVRLLAATPRATTSLFDMDFHGPSAVLVGAEGAGLPDWAIAQSDMTFSIPMRDGVESLNVAVSTGLIAYEAFRQRRTANAGKIDFRRESIDDRRGSEATVERRESGPRSRA